MSSGESTGKGLDLQWQILIGIVAGIVLGLGLNISGANSDAGALFWMKTIFGYGGDIFVRLLRMTIVPLVFASIFMAIANLGDPRELGRIGSKTVAYYFATTALAVLAGLILVNIIHPGQGIPQETLDTLELGVPEIVSDKDVGDRSASLIIIDTLINMIPRNPAAALADGDVLQIIFFTIFIALMAAMVGKGTESMVKAIEGLDLVMNRAVMAIMRIAPICIFFLVTALMMDLGLEAIRALGRYAMTVLLGLLVHAAITLPILVAVIGRYNPLKLFQAMLPAILTAWSTASSAATLPITMESLEKRAGVDERIGNFVLPLGATVNMDGTALYESVAVIFIAELLGIPLSPAQQVIIFITATLAAIGAAAIPGAGLITMGIVLTAVGLPLDGIGLILAIDRILDQFRTAVNVWGDATAGVVVGRLENAISDPPGGMATMPAAAD